jgi:hypothetical protein
MQTLSTPFALGALQIDLINSLFDGMLEMMDMQVHVSKAALLDAALLAQAPAWYADGGEFGQAQLSRAWACGREAAAIVGGMQGRLAAVAVRT